VARSGTAAHVERIVSAWRRADRLEERRAEGERHESRHMSLHIDEDGMYVVRGRLDPEAGALLERALESAGEALFGRRPESRAESGSKSRQASHPDARSESTPAAQRRADALGLVAERALAVRDAGKARSAFEVVVHVDAEALRQDSAALRQDSAALRPNSAAGQSVIAGGARVSAETSRRLACDAGRRVMTCDENGRTLDVGRRSRTVPATIRRALEHRDRRCRFPGCELRYCDAHHIVHWADGGTTALANLVLLCRRHHRAVHEAGFRIERDTAGDLRFHHPTGRVIPNVPAAPTLQGDLASRHAAHGVVVNSEALISFSTGQPLDVSHAIVTLRGGWVPGPAMDPRRRNHTAGSTAADRPGA
jgi:hypothetical protein